MKTTKFIVLFLVIINSYGQNKPMKFYDGNGAELSKEIFIENPKNGYLNLFFDKDTIIYGLSLKRKNFGKLNTQTLTELKNYLFELKGSKIDSTKNIVVNYLSASPKKSENSRSISGWNIFDDDYLQQLNKISKIEHYWVNSPKSDNLKYYHSKEISWLTDKRQYIEKLFFPYDIKYGGYIIIKPNGYYFYYLGEYSKVNVWENSKKFLK